jgi:hypothetical protein
MLGLFTDPKTVFYCVKKVVQAMAPVLMLIYIKPHNSYINNLHPLWILAVQSALKYTSNDIS